MEFDQKSLGTLNVFLIFYKLTVLFLSVFIILKILLLTTNLLSSSSFNKFSHTDSALVDRTS